MAMSQVKFEGVDRQTQALAQTLESAGGRGVELHLEGRLAEIFKNIAAVIAKVGGLAYGGLSSELTPEQAGKILGISRPLVVHASDDQRPRDAEDLAGLFRCEFGRKSAVREAADFGDHGCNVFEYLGKPSFEVKFDAASACRFQRLGQRLRLPIDALKLDLRHCHFDLHFLRYLK